MSSGRLLPIIADLLWKWNPWDLLLWLRIIQSFRLCCRTTEYLDDSRRYRAGLLTATGEQIVAGPWFIKSYKSPGPFIGWHGTFVPHASTENHRKSLCWEKQIYRWPLKLDHSDAPLRNQKLFFPPCISSLWKWLRGPVEVPREGIPHIRNVCLENIGCFGSYFLWISLFEAAGEKTAEVW